MPLRKKDHYRAATAVDPATIGFIIPSVGRPTLADTIDSLLRQDNGSWRALVVFDNTEPTLVPSDPRVSVVCTPRRLGKGTNGAGMVRNFGAPRVACEWVAFVDDDDVLTPDYVGLALRSIRENPGMDILIFRMKNQDGTVLPPPGASVFEVNQVGISFCVRREVLLRFPFRPSPIEDFLFLDRCRSAGCGMVLSPHTTYLVRPK